MVWFCSSFSLTSSLTGSVSKKEHLPACLLDWICEITGLPEGSTHSRTRTRLRVARRVCTFTPPDTEIPG